MEYDSCDEYEEEGSESDDKEGSESNGSCFSSKCIGIVAVLGCCVCIGCAILAVVVNNRQSAPTAVTAAPSAGTVGPAVGTVAPTTSVAVTAPGTSAGTVGPAVGTVAPTTSVAVTAPGTCTPQPGCTTCAAGLLKVSARKLGTNAQVQTVFDPANADCEEKKLMARGLPSVANYSVAPYQVRATYVNPLGPIAAQQELQLANGISEGTLMAYLKSLTTLPQPSFPSRNAVSPGINSTVAYLESTFKSMGLQTCLQSFRGNVNLPGLSVVDGRNVIAYIPGSSSASVVVGAHYDSRGSGTIVQLSEAPGADDDGSGVAAMLGVAKAFADGNIKPTKSVYFVAFGAEETGLIGSTFFSQALVDGQLPTDCSPVGGFAPGAKHKAIIMDMVGYANPSLPTPTLELEACDWTLDVVDSLAAATHDISGNTLRVGYMNNPFGSDHIPFIIRGIPAALVIHAMSASYAQYHTTEDKYSLINGTLMVKTTRMVFGAAMRMSI